MDKNTVKSTQVTFRINDDLLAKIDRAAAKRQRNRSDYIRLALARVMETEK